MANTKQKKIVKNDTKTLLLSLRLYGDTRGWHIASSCPAQAVGRLEPREELYMGLEYWTVKQESSARERDGSEKKTQRLKKRIEISLTWLRLLLTSHVERYTCLHILCIRFTRCPNEMDFTVGMTDCGNDHPTYATKREWKEKLWKLVESNLILFKCVVPWATCYLFLKA